MSSPQTVMPSVPFGCTGWGPERNLRDGIRVGLSCRKRLEGVGCPFL